MSKIQKLLVLQFRTNESGPHEKKCLYDELQDYDLNLCFVDAIEEELPTELIEEADGIILGGSGEFHLTKGDGEGEWLEETFDFLDIVVESSTPLMGICFGSQILAMHQGAVLTHDEEHHETGSFEIQLEKPSKDCEIFSNMPDRFHALVGHKDTAVEVPDHLVPLARSENAPNHAFKIKDKPAWGILFHPELDESRYRERLSMFLEYLPEGKTLDDVMDEVFITPQPLQIIHGFVDYISKYNKQTV